MGRKINYCGIVTFVALLLVSTGVWGDFNPRGDISGVTSLSLPSGVDPDVTAPGDLKADTNDHTLRGYDGVNQFSYGGKWRTMTFTITKPNSLDEADTLPVWKNMTEMDFVVFHIYSDSDTDNTDFALLNATSTDYSVTNTISTIQISNDQISVYTDLASGDEIEHAVITPDCVILFDNDATDDPDYVTFSIKGYFDADVN